MAKSVTAPRARKSFSRLKHVLDLPNLIDIQRESFDWFLSEGLRETIDVIRKTFPLRTCTDAVFRNRSRPCLEYQIKRCLGPCVLPVDRDEYGRHLHAAQMLLEGKNLELLREMRDQMKDRASKLEFEEAARIRDRVRAIEKTVEEYGLPENQRGRLIAQRD